MNLCGSRHVYSCSNGYPGHGQRNTYRGVFHGISGNVRYNGVYKGKGSNILRVDGGFVWRKGALVKAIRNEDVRHALCVACKSLKGDFLDAEAVCTYSTCRKKGIKLTWMRRSIPGN